MASKKKDDGWFWAAAGIGAASVLFWLFWKKKPAGPGVTTTKPVAPLSPPKTIPSVGAAAARFAEVKELYHMGYLYPTGAIAQVEALEAAVMHLRSAGGGEEASSAELLGKMDTFIAEVKEFRALVQPPGA